MLVILQFFGREEHEYGHVLNGDFLAAAGRGSKEGPSPFLAGVTGKRLVWASEVPQHKDLQVELIKAYCEQGGAPITALKLYKAPVSFTPMGVIFATSNYTVCITNRQDDSFRRRARIYQTRSRYVPKPATLTERKADAFVKQRIGRGEYSEQLFRLAVLLFPTLDQRCCPGTTLEPQPESVQQQGAELFAGGPAELLRAFLDKCEPAERVLASPMKDVSIAAAAACGLGPKQLGPLLATLCIAKDGTMNSAGVRILACPHPKWKGDGVPGMRHPPA